MNRSKLAVIASLFTGLLLLALAGLVQAQDQERGSIRGSVYRDVNGDGFCVNTGVQGEDPVANVPIEFVSSDEATVVTLKTGEDGTYGLVAAGQSIWRVTAKPAATDGIVSSENPRFAPVLPDSGLIQTGVNFCIAGGTVAGGGVGNAVIVLPVLPESGAAHVEGIPSIVTLFGALGATFLLLGTALEWRRRRLGNA